MVKGQTCRATLVAGETMALASALRKSVRWKKSGIVAILGVEDEDFDNEATLSSRLGLRTSASKGKAIQQAEPDSLSLLIKLTNDMQTMAISKANFDDFSASRLLKPFLDVVQALANTASLTMVALVSLQKLFSLEVIDKDSKDLALALHQTALALTHCRFEASSSAENEMVLQQLLFCMQELVAPEFLPFLSGVAVIELVETCLSMIYHMRDRSLQRHTTTNVLTNILRALFATLSNLPVDDKTTDLAEVLDGARHQPVEDLQVGSELNIDDSRDPKGNGTAAAQTAPATAAQEDAEPDTWSAKTEKPDDLSPYDTATLRRVFRAVVSVVDPASVKTDDQTRVVVIGLLVSCFEAAGPEIALHPSFVDIISVQLLKYLAQIIRKHNPLLLTAALRLFILIVELDPRHYKLQLEFVLLYMLATLTPLTDLPRDIEVDKMFYDGVPSRPSFVETPFSGAAASRESTDSGRSTPFGGNNNISKLPELKEIMVEAIVRLVKPRDFFPSLFANYDCDIQQTDLCRDLVGFLCRNAYPDSATWSTPSVPPLCLEAVLSFLNSLKLRLESSPLDSNAPESDSVKNLKASHLRKVLEIEAATAFNENPKKGIEAALKSGIIADSTPLSIATFLRSSRRLNKTGLGRFIAKKNNSEILEAFLSEFDFDNKRIDEALREFLATFRLPGESGEIEPIFERFSQRYMSFESNHSVLASSDAAFILCYSIIMLNTDQHSPQVKERMAFTSFQNNLRGTNDGKDFDTEFLEEIYQTIKHREIILPDEHDNDETFEYAWRKLSLNLAQTSESADVISTAVDRYVFDVCWKPIVSTLSFVFATATDDVVFSRVIRGLHTTAKLASAYKISGPLDQIAECLSKIATLTSGDLSCPTNNIEIVIKADGEKQKRGHSVIVSDLSVPFGSDLKAQMASITLFKLFQSEASISFTATGWSTAARAVTNLYLYDLCVPFANVPHVKPCYTFERSKAGRSVGIFSALSSLLISGSDAPPEPNDEEVDAALGAQDCVAACRIGEMLKYMADHPTKAMIDGIFSSMPSQMSSERYVPAMNFLIAVLKNTATTEESKSELCSIFEDFDLAQCSPDVRGHIISALLSSIPSNPEGIKSVLQTAVKYRAEAPTFAAELLAFDGRYPEVWDILSGLQLSTKPSQKQTHNRKASTASKEGSIPAIAKKVYDYCIDHRDEITQEGVSYLLWCYLRTLEAGCTAALSDINSLGKTADTLDQYKAFLSVMVEACLVSDAKVRENALDSLQKFLLDSEQVQKFRQNGKDIFEDSILPILENLLKQGVYKRDPRGMDLTRQRTASVACKVYLQYALKDDESVESIWPHLLQTLDRLLSSNQLPAVTESITEGLKNIILVLKLSSKGSETFWNETVSGLNEFLPALADIAAKADVSDNDADDMAEPTLANAGEQSQTSTEQLVSAHEPESSGGASPDTSESTADNQADQPGLTDELKKVKPELPESSEPADDLC